MAAQHRTRIVVSQTISNRRGEAECPDPPRRWRRDEIADLTSHELGELGEDIAAAHLSEMGLRILERNYRSHEGEVDIVALDESDGTVVLCEVKTRRVDRERGIFAEEAVDRVKQRRYRRIAAAYLMEHYPTPSIRFDVIAVSVPLQGAIEVHHIPGAFGWDANE